MDQGSQSLAAPSREGSNPRKRTQSRASTTSTHSVATQPNMEQSAFGDASDLYGAQWVASSAAHAGMSQMSPERMILQAASQMQSMDPSLDNSATHALMYQQHPDVSAHGMHADSFVGNASFTEGDSQMLDREENEEGDSIAGAQKGSRTSANNELEMRQLFRANKNRTLPEVAKELHGNERGPNSERTRQVFAMLWYGPVPFLSMALANNFAQDQLCLFHRKGISPPWEGLRQLRFALRDERITVLNPASFGKLVRVLFPGLKTRRLGVRGESKYHYVNFSLVDDQPEEPMPLPMVLPEPSFSQGVQVSAPPVNPAVHMPAHGAPDVAQPLANRIGVSAARGLSHSLYHDPEFESVDQLPSTATKSGLCLAFATDAQFAFQESEPLALPRLEPFLPPGTDPDAAKSLTALYRAQCTSLVECIRFVKEKTFFHLFTAFQGTLTMPVQKLFSNPGVAPWIDACDFVLYQRMMRILSALTLQVLPKTVLDTLGHISEKLVTHIREAFQGQPAHVIKAKEAPAAVFAALLDRVLRVNLTAHAAANMLSNPANRDQMYMDWISMVRIRKVAECVPTRGMDDVVSLILTELRDLLNPANVPWDMESLTPYGEMALKGGRLPGAEAAEEATGQNVLDRWVGFLQSLATRFPYASHADIVWCVERVGTAVLRDITIAGGKSFGAWWVTKCWVDEMVASQEASRRGSRYSSGSDDFSFNQPLAAQPEQSGIPVGAEKGGHEASDLAGEANHDDSGIGIRTPDEDVSVERFSFATVDERHLLRANDLPRTLMV